MKQFIKQSIPLAWLQRYLGITHLANRLQRLEEEVEASYSLSSQAPSQSDGNQGYQVIRLDYPIKPSPRYGWDKPAHPLLYERINKKRAQYREYLEKFLDYQEDFFNIPVHASQSPLEPNWYNGYFPALDSISLYSFLCLRKPGNFFEIGSGNSTKFARKAVKNHLLSTHILSIDPQPRAEIDKICDEIIRKPLEEADLAVFDRLEPGDFLFLDGSHRCFTNSDVTIFFLEILPNLKPGIWVEIHDIFLPFDYPAVLNKAFYTEQYLLASFLLGGSSNIDIILPNTFITYDAELSNVLSPVFSDPRMRGAENLGVSFWFETKSG